MLFTSVFSSFLPFSPKNLQIGSLPSSQMKFPHKRNQSHAVFSKKEPMYYHIQIHRFNMTSYPIFKSVSIIKKA